MKWLPFYDRLNPAGNELVRRVESSIAQAFARLQARWPAIGGVELTFTFSAASVDSEPVAHGLGVAPNRFLVTYSTNNVTHRFISADANFVAFRRSTLASGYAKIVVWRDPFDGADATIV